MVKRYVGDATIHITYHDEGDYRGRITCPGGEVWKFRDLHAPRIGLGAGVAYDSPEAYDRMAQAAVNFGSYYTTHNRGDDVPEWAPEPEVADAIEEAVLTDGPHDDGSYATRTKKEKEDEMSGVFKLSIRLGNAAMQSKEDVADALEREVAARLRSSDAPWGAIKDANGNTVGWWEFFDEEEDET